MANAFKAMAASEGIFFVEVPEGLPLAVISVHPNGEIDKSSIDEDDFTLLQIVTKDPDSVLAYYRDHFEGIGWSAGDPFTIGNRTRFVRPRPKPRTSPEFAPALGFSKR